MSQFEESAPGATRLRNVVVLVAILIAILALVPIYLTHYLPLNDYPFHLARMVILAQLDNPIFARFYEQGSFFLPNMAMDAVAVPLSMILGPELATRVFVELTLLALLFGTMALHWAAHRRLSVWPLLAIIFLHNGIFRFGFLNYLFGLGLALCAAALWMTLRPGLLRFSMALIASILLMYCHLEAFCVFAIIAGSIELERTYELWTQQKSWKELRGLVTAASPFLLSIALFIYFSPTAGVGGAAGIAYAPGLGTKPIGALFSLSSGILWLDGISILIALGVFAWLAISRKLTISPPLAVATIMMALALFVVPDAVMGALYADVRIGPAIALLAIATFDLRAQAGRSAVYAVAAIVIALGAVRAGALTQTWANYDREIGSIVNALSKVEPGSTVFAATSEPYPSLIADTAERRQAWSPSLKHVASYAVLGGPVFVPATWAEPTQQPLNVKPDYKEAYRFQGNNPRRVYDDAALPDFVAKIRGNVESGSWRGLGNVYVLVVGTKGVASAATVPSISIVGKGDRFALLRLNTAAPATERTP